MKKLTCKYIKYRIIFLLCKRYQPLKPTAPGLSLSFEGREQVHYGETTLDISEVKKEDLQANFTCIVGNEMHNKKATVTLELKAQCEGRIFHFVFLHLDLSLKYIGDCILLFVSVNNKKNQSVSSLQIQASGKICLASLGYESP